MSEKTATVGGSCLCGAVRFELDFPSKFVCHCHCNNCRRAHGAAFVTWAGFPEAQMRILAGAELLSHYLTDTQATRSFCSRCGSTLFYRSPRWPDKVDVAVANVEGELDGAPSGHVYADRAPRWSPILDELPRYGGETGMVPM